MIEYEYTAVLAAADRQLAHTNLALDGLLKDARKLLQTHGQTQTAAILAQRVKVQLSCDDRFSGFAAEMLAAAVLRLAEQ